MSRQKTAARLVKAALVKSGLADEDAEAVIELIAAESGKQSFNDTASREKVVNKWISCRPVEQQSFLKQIIYQIIIAESVEHIDKLFRIGYDEVRICAEEILNYVEQKKNSGTATSEEIASATQIAAFKDKVGKDENSASSNSFLAPQIENFGYYNQAEFLWRKYLKDRQIVLGRYHIYNGISAIGLIANLAKQGRQKSINDELCTALYNIKFGNTMSENFDYNNAVNIFSLQFEYNNYQFICVLLKAFINRLRAIGGTAAQAVPAARELLAKRCAGIVGND